MVVCIVGTPTYACTSPLFVCHYFLLLVITALVVVTLVSLSCYFWARVYGLINIGKAGCYADPTTGIGVVFN